MLYTIIINFEDRTDGLGQYEEDSPEKALTKFIRESESLEEYDRSKIINAIDGKKEILIHLADMKGVWATNFGTRLLDIPELSTIFGGFIVQTDPKGPVRIK